MIRKDRRIVYVAGAYSADNTLDTLNNMRIGMQTGAELFRAGFTPFVPWLDYHFCLMIDKKYLTIEMFYQYSMDFLECSDAVYLVDNPHNAKSTGAIKELEMAMVLGLPVFTDKTLLFKWAEEEGNE